MHTIEYLPRFIFAYMYCGLWKMEELKGRSKENESVMWMDFAIGEKLARGGRSFDSSRHEILFSCKLCKTITLGAK